MFPRSCYCSTNAIERRPYAVLFSPRIEISETLQAIGDDKFNFHVMRTLLYLFYSYSRRWRREKAQHWTARKHSLVQDPYHKTESIFYAAQQHWATDWFPVCQSGESEYKPVSVQREYKQKNAGLGLFLRMANYAVRQHRMRPALWICTNLWKDMDKTWRTKSDTVTE